MSTQPKPAVQFPDRPKAEDILERARSLRPDLLAAAAQTEADRRVSAEAMASFEEAGLIHISRSRRYGGYGYGPSMLVRLGYELGQDAGAPPGALILQARTVGSLPIFPNRRRMKSGAIMKMPF